MLISPPAHPLPPCSAFDRDDDAKRTKRARGVATATVALLLVVLLGGCTSITVKTTGAASVEDLQAENAYIALYMDHMRKVAEDAKAFHPSGNDPGPCDKGGNAQDCLNVDARAMETLQDMLVAVKGATVPPRYAEADRLIRDALAKNIQGLDLRNRAIQQHDNALWTQHRQVLDQAVTAWRAGYAAFPADNKPPLAP